MRLFLLPGYNYDGVSEIPTLVQSFGGLLVDKIKRVESVGSLRHMPERVEYYNAMSHLPS